MTIRDPAWAGQFYPADKKELEETVDRLVDAAEVGKVEGKLLGMMVPHAGYVYSGGVAGYAYRYIRESSQSFDTVLLIGNGHHALVDGVAVYDGEGFASPLGEVQTDTELAKTMIKAGAVNDNAGAHIQEHSLEVQMPFLQRVLNDFKIVPLLLGPRLSVGLEDRLAEAICAAAGKRSILLLASSDMSHYPDHKTAVDVDRHTLEAVASLDPEEVGRVCGESMSGGHAGLDTVLCGEGAVRLTLKTAVKLGATSGRILRYQNSGDVSGDGSRVVGYGAVALTGV